jgi:hypothetical protein
MFLMLHFLFSTSLLHFALYTHCCSVPVQQADIVRTADSVKGHDDDDSPAVSNLRRDEVSRGVERRAECSKGSSIKLRLQFAGAPCIHSVLLLCYGCDTADL